MKVLLIDVLHINLYLNSPLSCIGSAGVMIELFSF